METSGRERHNQDKFGGVTLSKNETGNSYTLCPHPTRPAQLLSTPLLYDCNLFRDSNLVRGPGGPFLCRYGLSVLLDLSLSWIQSKI